MTEVDVIADLEQDNRALRALIERLEQEARLMRVRMERLEKERDELLEALAETSLALRIGHRPMAALERARAAIAKVEGKQ